MVTNAAKSLGRVTICDTGVGVAVGGSAGGDACIDVSVWGGGSGGGGGGGVTTAGVILGLLVAPVCVWY